MAGDIDALCPASRQVGAPFCRLLVVSSTSILWVPGSAAAGIQPRDARCVVLSFDFRRDMGQIDVLKAIPIEPIVLTAGQLFVPVVTAA